MAARGMTVVVNSTALKTARIRAEMTQQQLANAVDLTNAQISRMELGRQNSTILTVRKIAEVLKLDVTDLLVTPEQIESNLVES